MSTLNNIRKNLKMSRKVNTNELSKESGVSHKVIIRIEKRKGVNFESYRAYIQTLMGHCGLNERALIRDEVNKFILGEA